MSAPPAGPSPGWPEGAPSADLAAAEAMFEAALAPDRVLEFDVGPLDRVGVPVWASWWDVGQAMAGGTGYGATQQRARVGSLGELVEHVASHRALTGPVGAAGRDASRRELLARGEEAADPRLLGLPAGTDYDDDRPLRWLPTTRWRDGARVWVPAEFVGSSPGELRGPPPPGGRLAVPVSNGLGAGSTIEMAVAHALGEILQRDGNGLVFRALDAGVVVDLDGLDHPGALRSLDRLRAAGVDVTVKLAAVGDGVVNVYAVGAAAGDGVVVATACGEAAHPDPGEAVAKALAEFAHARARKAFQHGPLADVARVASAEYLDTVLPRMDPAHEEPRVLAAMVSWLRAEGAALDSLRSRLDGTVFSRRSTVAWSSLPAAPWGIEEGPKAELDHLVTALALDGLEVLVADFSQSVAPAHAVKAIVPGTEVETVAYGRIGARNARRLVAAGRDDLVRVGRRPEGWQRVHLDAAGLDLLGGPAWLNRAALDRVCGDLLPLYREPGRHTAARVAGAG